MEKVSTLWWCPLYGCPFENKNLKYNVELVFLMTFQVDVSFHFKKYTRNAASKIKCNMILSSFAFDLQAGDFLLTCYD